MFANSAASVAAELTSEDQQLLELIKKRVCDFEDTLGSHYRDGLWSRMDKLYHNWTQLRAALRGTRGNDRDTVYRDAMDEFGCLWDDLRDAVMDNDEAAMREIIAASQKLRREILVHALDTRDAPALAQDILHRYERPLKEIFG